MALATMRNNKRVHLDEKRVLSDLNWILGQPQLLSRPSQILDDPLHTTRDSEENTAGKAGWKGFDNFQFSAEARKLGQLVAEKEVLSFVERNCKSNRVGDYFECLVHFALLELEKHEIVYFSHQICQEGRTLGELDFVIRDQDGEVIHLEVAIKYFLFHPQVRSEDLALECSDARLIGPNPADSLVGKVERMTAHQLPLSRHLLATRIDRRMQLVLGLIHYPIDLERQEISALNFKFLSDSHRSGLWLPRSQLGWLSCEYPNFLFLRMRKPHWLAASGTHAELKDVFTFKKDLEYHFENSSSPVLCSIMKDSGNELAVEVRRLFVVPDSWPFPFETPASAKRI